MKTFEAEILALHCSSCTVTFSTVSFTGDTDMTTLGLASATSNDGHEIIVGEMQTDELVMGYDAGLDKFAHRVSVDRQVDYSAVHFIRSFGGTTSRPGVSFQEFLKGYEPRELVFRCPGCGSEALVSERLSPAQFVQGGGAIRLLGGLSLD